MRFLIMFLFSMFAACTRVTPVVDHIDTDHSDTDHDSAVYQPDTDDSISMCCPGDQPDGYIGCTIIFDDESSAPPLWSVTGLDCPKNSTAPFWSSRCVQTAIGDD